MNDLKTMPEINDLNKKIKEPNKKTNDKKTKDTVIMLQRIFENPVSRILLKHLTAGNRLDNALEVYCGLRKPRGLLERFNSVMIGHVIDKGAKVFGANNRNNYVDYFKDPVTRRGLNLVLRSIAEYGVTKPQKLAAPFLVVWDFTSMCNLKCKHCYANAGRRRPDELTTAQAKQVVDQLYDAGVIAVAISGGEPLTRPDFFEIARYIYDKGMYVSVATNGVLITREVAEKMKHAGVGYVEISLDHTDPKKHDEFRGVKGAWEATVQGIKNCVEAGICTGIATTATKYNYEDIPEMYKLALKLKVDRFMVFNFIPTRRARDMLEADLTPEQREELLNFLYDKLEEGKDNLLVFSTSPSYARISLERVAKKRGTQVVPTHFAGVALKDEAVYLADFIGGCGAGRNYCSVEYNGDIQPCVFIPIKVGNVLKDGFSNVWRNSKVLNTLRDRDLLKGGCGRCKYKYICGGCRARGYVYTGDIMGADPGCVIAQESPQLQTNDNHR